MDYICREALKSQERIFFQQNSPTGRVIDRHRISEGWFITLCLFIYHSIVYQDSYYPNKNQIVFLHERKLLVKRKIQQKNNNTSFLYRQEF